MKRKRVDSYRRYGKRLKRSFPKRAKRTRSRRRTRYGSPLTYDNDFTTDYRYKRMPAGKRNRWKRFVKKVQAVTAKDQGLKKLVYYDSIKLTSLYNECGNYSASLYTPDAQVNNLHADLGTIFRNILGNAPYDNINTITTTGDVDKRIKFESAMLECTWRNIGNSTVIVDLYYFKTRKTFGLTNQDADNNVHGVYRLGLAKEGRIIDEEDQTNVGGAVLQPGTIGATPFMSSLFCQTFKIMWKKRITIAPGNFFSMVLKDPKNRMVNATDTRARICMAGLTHGYFFQFAGICGEVTGIPVSSTDSAILFSQIKRYNFYLPVSGKDQTAFTHPIAV